MTLRNHLSLSLPHPLWLARWILWPAVLVTVLLLSRDTVTKANSYSGQELGRTPGARTVAKSYYILTWRRRKKYGQTDWAWHGLLKPKPTPSAHVLQQGHTPSSFSPMTGHSIKPWESLLSNYHTWNHPLNSLWFCVRRSHVFQARSYTPYAAEDDAELQSLLFHNGALRFLGSEIGFH